MTRTISRPIKHEYTTTRSPQDRQIETTLSLPEYQVVRRIRQLRENGSTLVIVDLSNDKPMVRKVGNAESSDQRK